MLRLSNQMCRQVACTLRVPSILNTLQKIPSRKMTQQRVRLDWNTSIPSPGAKDKEKITALGWFLLVCNSTSFWPYK